MPVSMISLPSVMPDSSVGRVLDKRFRGGVSIAYLCLLLHFGTVNETMELTNANTCMSKNIPGSPIE